MLHLHYPSIGRLAPFVGLFMLSISFRVRYEITAFGESGMLHFAASAEQSGEIRSPAPKDSGGRFPVNAAGCQSAAALIHDKSQIMRAKSNRFCRHLEFAFQKICIMVLKRCILKDSPS